MEEDNKYSIIRTCEKCNKEFDIAEMEEIIFENEGYIYYICKNCF